MVILDDLNLAARYSDRIMILKDGGTAAEGVPSQVLSPETIRAVFDIDVTVSDHPVHHCPLVITS